MSYYKDKHSHTHTSSHTTHYGTGSTSDPSSFPSPSSSSPRICIDPQAPHALYVASKQEEFSLLKFKNNFKIDIVQIESKGSEILDVSSGYV